jgi:hypothetical protein
VAGNPRRNALFGVVSETPGLRRLDGGGSSQIRTGLSVFFPVIRELTGKISRFCDFGALENAIKLVDSVG